MEILKFERMKKIIAMFILNFLVIASCTKKADIDLPTADEKLVVTCFISPGDSVLTAVVRTSKLKYGVIDTARRNKIYQDVENAYVSISDGVNSITLPFNLNEYFYKASTSNFPIVSGKNYFLTVSTPDGKKVTANTTVPSEKLPIELFEITEKKADSLFIEFDVNVTVADIPNQINYVGLYVQNFSSTSLTEPYLYNQNSFTSFGSFDTDEFVGKTKYVFSSQNFIYEPMRITSAYSYVSALNCNKDFYLYNKSVQDATGSGGPFADPVMVYSNIDGGFGCFGAFVVSTQNKKIR